MTEIFISKLFFFLNSGLWHGHFRDLVNYTKVYSFIRSQKIITFYFFDFLKMLLRGVSV